MTSKKKLATLAIAAVALASSSVKAGDFLTVYLGTKHLQGTEKIDWKDHVNPPLSWNELNPGIGWIHEFGEPGESWTIASNFAVFQDSFSNAAAQASLGFVRRWKLGETTMGLNAFAGFQMRKTPQVSGNASCEIADLKNGNCWNIDYEINGVQYISPGDPFINKWEWTLTPFIAPGVQFGIDQVLFNISYIPRISGYSVDTFVASVNFRF